MSMPPATLIVVDDDAEIRELLADYLGRHGYRALVAEDAEALHRLLDHEAPQLMIVDIMLPQLDGISPRTTNEAILASSSTTRTRMV